MQAHRVTLLIASEGFGKTTVLAQYMDALDVPSLRYAAGSGHDPAEVAAWLRERSPAFRGVIALDALDCDSCGSECAREVAAAIERHGANVRWIVACRSSGALPLGSWLVYGDAAIPIAEPLLRFTENEAREAAPALDEATFERIYRATGGWPAAFVKAAAGRGSERDIAECVYESLSEPERVLLGVGAALPRLDAELLELAGCVDAAATLAQVLRRLPALAAADPAGDRLLQYALERGGKEQSALRYARAGDALAAAGHVLLALHAYVRAGAARQIFDLARTQGVVLIEQGHIDAIDAAVNHLDATEFAGHPVALGLRAHIESVRGRYREAAALYRRALRATKGDEGTAAMLAARFATVLLNLGEDPSALVESFASDATLPTAARAQALAVLAVARARFNSADVRPTLDELDPAVLHIEDDAARAQTMHVMGAAAMLSGDAMRAARLLGTAAEIARSRGMFRLATLAYTSLSSNAVNDEDFPAGLAAAERALECAVASEQFSLARLALARQIDIEVSRGDEQRVEHLLQEYGDLSGPEPAVLTYLRLFARAMLAAWRGSFGEAAKIARQLGNESVLPEERLVTTACCALFLVLSGDREEARNVIDEAVRQRRACGAQRSAGARAADMATALCAVAEGFAERTVAAERLVADHAWSSSPLAAALREASSTIVRHCVTGVVLDDVRAQLDVMRSHWYGGYARLFEAAIASSAQRSGTDVALTRAELCVIRELNCGRSPKEIARSLGCSVHTVRWHIRRAIAKFGCSGQAQALRAAKARGILE